MTPIHALIRLLADSAVELGMGTHSYIVGGAPRDFVLGHEIKDIDAVVEPLNGKDAVTLARRVAEKLGVSCHPDHYGVVHVGPVMQSVQHLGVDLIGQKVEIVTSRKEKYDRTRGKDSHKPTTVEVGTILDDVHRRDFTINTLMWRLQDLQEGPIGAPILDLLHSGLVDLHKGILRTPLEPEETFDDDPTRMLRAIRFAVKYDFEIPLEVRWAIKRKAPELLRLPYEAIDALFFDKILTMPLEKVRAAFAMIDNLGLLVPVATLIPTSRMRRAIQERITDPRTIIFLASHKLSTGHKFVGEQLNRFQEASAILSDADLESLWKRFLKPLDTERFMANTGASGAAIGAAVESAKNFVLTGLTAEEVQAKVEVAHASGTL